MLEDDLEGVKYPEDAIIRLLPLIPHSQCVLIEKQIREHSMVLGESNKASEGFIPADNFKLSDNSIISIEDEWINNPDDRVRAYTAFSAIYGSSRFYYSIVFELPPVIVANWKEFDAVIRSNPERYTEELKKESSKIVLTPALIRSLHLKKNAIPRDKIVELSTAIIRDSSRKLEERFEAFFDARTSVNSYDNFNRNKIASTRIKLFNDARFELNMPDVPDSWIEAMYTPSPIARLN